MPESRSFDKKGLRSASKSAYSLGHELANEMESSNLQHNSPALSNEYSELRDEMQIHPQHQEHLVEAGQDDDLGTKSNQEEHGTGMEASPTLEDRVPDPTALVNTIYSPSLQHWIIFMEKVACLPNLVTQKMNRTRYGILVQENSSI